jgi:hypothetical protein
VVAVSVAGLAGVAVIVVRVIVITVVVIAMRVTAMRAAGVAALDVPGTGTTLTVFITKAVRPVPPTRTGDMRRSTRAPLLRESFIPQTHRIVVLHDISRE